MHQGFIYHYLNQGDVDDAYIVQTIWQYNNTLDINKLKKAWELTQAKYPSLRLRFCWDEELVQVIDSIKESRLDFRYIDFSKAEYLKDTNEQEYKIREVQQKVSVR